jgi:hypothetical protein
MIKWEGVEKKWFCFNVGAIPASACRDGEKS